MRALRLETFEGKRKAMVADGVRKGVLCLCACLAFLVVLPSSLQAAKDDILALLEQLEETKDGGEIKVAKRVKILSIEGGMLEVEERGQTKPYNIPLDRIVSVECYVPGEINGAYTKYISGDESGMEEMEGKIDAYIKYMNLPDSNVPKAIFEVADLYRQVGDFKNMQKYVDHLKLSTNPEVSSDAAVLEAYMHEARGVPDKAKELMDVIALANKDDDIFALDRIVRAKILMKDKDYKEAAVFIGEAIGLTSIDSPYYAEALYVGALCYRVLDEAVKTLGTGKIKNNEEKLTDEEVENESLSDNTLKQLTLIFPDNPWANIEKTDISKILEAAKQYTPIKKEEKMGGEDGDDEKKGAGWSKFKKQIKDEPKEEEEE